MNELLLKMTGFPVVRKFLCFPKPYWFKAIHSWPHSSFPWTNKKVTFSLSFDCDNPTDAQALPQILDLLDEYKIKCSFAVCGQLAEENANLYRQAVTRGHEILNHGYSKHVYVDSSGELNSCLFYDRLPRKQIEKEIADNHDCLKQALGIEAIGFRTPHFGCFQKRDDFDFLYSILSAHGYKYSTSSFAHVFKKLRLWKNNCGIQEFPLSGYAAKPFSVYDSWSFMQKEKLGQLFLQFNKTMTLCLKSGNTIFFNIYLDPSHIVGLDGFKQMLALIASLREQIAILTYKDMIESPLVKSEHSYS